MEALTKWIPEPTELSWDEVRGGLVCAACPDHLLPRGEGRYELVLAGPGLDGPADHHVALVLERRSPGLCSGPYQIPTLPPGMPALVIIDYLERQTFDRAEAQQLGEALERCFPSATVHTWRIGPEVGRRIAEDAYWDEGTQLLVRTRSVDIEPERFPMDVGWRPAPAAVVGPDGQRLELWRGCLYVDPFGPRLVRYGWRDLPGGGRWARRDDDRPTGNASEPIDVMSH